MCGKSSPVFFRGVATVAAKMFNISLGRRIISNGASFAEWKTLSTLFIVSFLFIFGMKVYLH